MTKYPFLSGLLAASFTLFMASVSSWAGSLAVTDVAGGTITSAASNRTLGFLFTPGNDMIVETMGIWDEDGDGLVGFHNVGIWNAAHQLMANVAITAGTSVPVSGPVIRGGQVRSKSTFVYLNAGRTYTMSAHYENNDGYIASATSLTMAAPFTYLDEGMSAAGSGYSFPSGTGTHAGFFGPSFTYRDVVPEPASVLASAATLCLVRRRRMNCA